MKTDVWFIILAYYSDPKELRRVRDSVAGFPVVIVENTVDPTKRFRVPVDSFFKQTVLLSHGINRGYAGGMNDGIKYALDHGAQWVVLVNDDIHVPDKLAGVLVKKLQSLPPAVAGAFPGALDNKRCTTILFDDPYKQRKQGEFAYLSGSFLCIHADIVRTAGYLYEPFFMYYEDVDYSQRVMKSGFPIIHTPFLGLKHTTKKTKNEIKLMKYYLARNHLLFVERHASTRVKIHELMRVPKTIAEHNAHNDQSAVRGMKDYFLRRFGRGEGIV